MIQDLAGLLVRIQELEPLCADRGVRRAVEKGDPFAVYRALWWARLTGRLKAHRQTLALLLRTRRAFARPLKGKLFLGTFNGFGATLLGSDEAEPDGTHVAVHWVVALFAIPIFPLGAYVVAGGERKGLSTSWNIFARVPLGLVTWAWSRGIALAIGVAVVWAGGAAFWASRHHDLTVLNGLNAPLTVTVGKATAEVRALGMATLNLPVDRLPARAAVKGGAVVDALDLDVRSGSGRAVWNVAGAAPLYQETVIYTAKPDPNAKAPPAELHCGDRHVVIGAADDYFKAPPRQVSMREGTRRVVRRHVDVAREQGTDGAQLCAGVLADRGRLADAVHVAEARAVAGGWRVEQADLAMFIALAAGKPELERVARAYQAARPGDTEAVRAYQHALDGAGKHAELVEEFRKRAAAAPEDPKAQYLYLRLLDGPEAVQLEEAALARFPRDPDLLRLGVAMRTEDGDFAGAERAWRVLNEVAPAEKGNVLLEAATAMVAQGRVAEARAEMAEAAKMLKGWPRRYAAMLHVLTAALLTHGVDEALVGKWQEVLGAKELGPWLRVRCGLPVEGDALRGEDAVYAALRRDPARALELAGKLLPIQVVQLDPEAWALAYFEAVRAGAAVAGPLAAHSFSGLRPRPELARFVRGENAALPDRLPLPLRAAARFVRSRASGLDPQERKRLLEAARADDRLGGLVSQAIAAWPPASR